MNEFNEKQKKKEKNLEKKKKFSSILTIIMIVLWIITIIEFIDYFNNVPISIKSKPIIYIYPEEEMNVSVKLKNDSLITTSYPKYNDGWTVLASPDGTLKDPETNRSYYGLYYEGKNNDVSMQEDGFIVKGEDTTQFLEEKLELLGLNEREANEFIIYWLPRLEESKYNYIRFETKEEIDSYMPLEISPKPDTVIRVVMNFKPLDEKVKIKEQILTSTQRSGYTVVEWGGSEIK